MSTAELPAEKTPFEASFPVEPYDYEAEQGVRPNLFSRIWHSRLGRFAVIGTGVLAMSLPAVVEVGDTLVHHWATEGATTAADVFWKRIIEKVNKEKGQLSQEYINELETAVDKRLPGFWYKNEKRLHADLNGDGFIGKPKSHNSHKNGLAFVVPKVKRR